MSVVPTAPQQMDPAQFRVRVTDNRGRPVTGAKVAVSLMMPAMDMGRNEVAGREDAAGSYTATGRFTMAGDWRVTVRAAKGAENQARSFPITVR